MKGGRAPYVEHRGTSGATSDHQRSDAEGAAGSRGWVIREVQASDLDVLTNGRQYYRRLGCGDGLIWLSV